MLLSDTVEAAIQDKSPLPATPSSLYEGRQVLRQEVLGSRRLVQL